MAAYGRALNAVPVRLVDRSGRPSDNSDNFAHVMTYNGDGTIATDAYNDGSDTWTQTYSYTSGNLTGLSAWVRS